MIGAAPGSTALACPWMWKSGASAPRQASEFTGFSPRGRTICPTQLFQPHGSLGRARQPCRSEPTTTRASAPAGMLSLMRRRAPFRRRTRLTMGAPIMLSVAFPKDYADSLTTESSRNPAHFSRVRDLAALTDAGCPRRFSLTSPSNPAILSTYAFDL